MNSKTSLSMFLSMILRHKPERAGITLDKHGWANVDDLIIGIKKTGRFIDMNTLTQITEDSKQRFSFNSDKTKIRANN